MSEDITQQEQAADPKVERLNQLRQAKAARETAKKDRAVDAELLLLELEVELEQECKGPRGVEFEIVDTLDGPIAVKLGAAVNYTTWGGKDTLPEVQQFVESCLAHPAKAEFRKMAMRRPGVAYAAAVALRKLFEGEKEREAGKP